MVLRFVRLVARAIACLMVTTVITPAAVAVTILATFLYLPLPATLPEPKPIAGSLGSTVLDKDGNPIATFREFEQNLPVLAKDVPLVLKEAVVSSEDRNFYHHGGVDLRGTIRALVADVRSGRAVQGGSTITQQYVKGAYTGKERTVLRKIREAVLASQLDRQTSKDDILFKYLSSIYLGEGSYGVGAASENYFHKPVGQLTLSESALLAGIIPAPSSYEPRDYPQLAEVRREQVLAKMLAQGYITQPQYSEALGQRVTTQCKLFTAETCVFPPKQDPATKYPYFVDYVRRYLIQALGPREVYGGGLIIQTTIDPAMQDLAEKKVSEALAGEPPPLDMSLVAVEPPTGFVKALVGGRDFAKSQVNEALGGCPGQPNPAKSNIEVTATCWAGTTVQGGGSGRQPGSAFKPFTLATAFSKGYSPNKTYVALNTYTTKDKFVMHNAVDGEGGGGPVTLRYATAKSINTVFGQLINDVGVKDTAAMAKKLGITSAWESPKYHGVSYTLGVIDVSPLDMASAYGTFACDGRRYDPTPIVKVIDATGKTLITNLARGNCGGEQVIDPTVASNVTDVLRGVLTSGTASHDGIGRPAAGKTGTTDNYVNAWFVGYTPTLSTAIWLGQSTGQDPARNSMRNLRAFGQTYPLIFGGGIPAQTWHNFMSEALANVPSTDFNQPPPIQKIVDAINKVARAGIDPGSRLYPGGTGSGGPYEIPAAPPVAVAPPTTTTSTTAPADQGGGGGGPGPPPPTTTTGLGVPGR